MVLESWEGSGLLISVGDYKSVVLPLSAQCCSLAQGCVTDDASINTRTQQRNIQTHKRNSDCFVQVCFSNIFKVFVLNVSVNK